MRAKKLIELVLLTTLALIIFVVEVSDSESDTDTRRKMGLANIITVYAAYQYRVK